MQSVISNVLANLTSGELWRVILTIIPFVCSITGIAIGINLIWLLLNWKLDTKHFQKMAKRPPSRFRY